eukprot:Gb_41799 [translate_table: standard]
MDTPSSERRMSRTPPFGLVKQCLKARFCGFFSLLYHVALWWALEHLTIDIIMTFFYLCSIERCSLCELVETPRTGDMLLLYQGKSLLQRVEVDSIKPPSSLRTLCHLNGFLASPNRLLGPTPDATVVPSAFAIGSSSLLTNKADHTIKFYVDLGMSSPRSETKMESPSNFSEENSPLPEVCIKISKLLTGCRA